MHPKTRQTIDRPESRRLVTSRSLFLVSVLLLSAWLAMHLHRVRVQQRVQVLKDEQEELNTPVAQWNHFERRAEEIRRQERQDQDSIGRLLESVREIGDLQLQNLDQIVWVTKQHYSDENSELNASIFFYVPEGDHHFLANVNPGEGMDLDKMARRPMRSGIDYELIPNSVCEARINVKNVESNTCRLLMSLFDSGGELLCDKEFDIESTLENADHGFSSPTGAFRPNVRDITNFAVDRKHAAAVSGETSSGWQMYNSRFYQKDEKTTLVSAAIESTGPILVDSLTLNPGNWPRVQGRLKKNPESARYLIYGENAAE